MAYPQEPQRPLNAPPTGVEAADTGPTGAEPPGTAPTAVVRGALLVFAAGLVAALALYAGVSAPGAWFPGAGAKVITAAGLTVTRGTGGTLRDALVISAVDESGLALVTANTDLRSSDHPVIAWSGTGFAERADVRFLWRTDYAPNKLNTIPVTVSSGRLTPIVMAGNPDWMGRITGVALAVRGPLAEPVRVTGVVAKPGGVVEQVSDRVREWSAYEGWSGASINTITGGADVQELPLPTLLIATLAVVAAAWFALARRRRITQWFPLVVASLFVAAWAVLDAQWTWNLSRQVAATRDQFGGKDLRERHVAADDGMLFQFVEKARAKMPAPGTSRVFVVADAPYFRGRAAYHLYPYNVQFDTFNNTVPAVTSLRSGDFVVVYQRRGVQYSADEKKLRFEGGAPVSAEAVLVEPGAALFRIL